MKELVRKRIIKKYENKVSQITSKYEQGALMIEISKKCSAYEISWEEFMMIRLMIKEQSIKLNLSFRY